MQLTTLSKVLSALLIFKVDAGADARDVAKSFNLSAGTTGINATAITKASITNYLMRQQYLLHYKVRAQPLQQLMQLVIVHQT